MKKILIIIVISGIPFMVLSQVIKNIQINTEPDNAMVFHTSKRIGYIGNTPLNHEFNFHSDISIQKIKISTCGCYDTIVSVTPGNDVVEVELKHKNIAVLPVTEAEEFKSENDKAAVGKLITNILEKVCRLNKHNNINHLNYVLYRHIMDSVYINLIFESNPAELIPKRGVSKDSLLDINWHKWFDLSVKDISLPASLKLMHIFLFVSVEAGKSDLNIFQSSGIKVHDELRHRTTYSYGPKYTYVTTTSWYETVTTPTFKSQPTKSLKKYENLYKLVHEVNENGFSIAGEAYYSFNGNTLSDSYVSGNGMKKNSVLLNYDIPLSKSLK